MNTTRNRRIVVSRAPTLAELQSGKSTWRGETASVLLGQVRQLIEAAIEEEGPADGLSADGARKILLHQLRHVGGVGPVVTEAIACLDAVQGGTILDLLDAACARAKAGERRALEAALASGE